MNLAFFKHVFLSETKYLVTQFLDHLYRRDYIIRTYYGWF